MSDAASVTSKRNKKHNARQQGQEPWDSRLDETNRVGKLGPYVQAFGRAYRAETDSPRSTYYYVLELDRLSKAFPDSEPKDITKTDLQHYYIERSEDLAPRTRARIVSILRRFFRWCVELDLVLVDPTTTLKRPKIPAPEPRFLPYDAVPRLMRCAAPNMQVFVALAAYAGLRKGSIHTLQWKDVDLDGGILTIRKAKGGKNIIIPIAPKLKEVLTVWKAMTRTNDSGFVYAHRRNGRWQAVYPSTSSKRFVKLAEAAGMPGVTAHDLRAHFATTLHRNGTDIAVISRLLGHADISTTLNHYAFTDDAQKEVAIKSLAY